MGEGGGKGKVKEGGPGKGKDKGYKKMRKRNVFLRRDIFDTWKVREQNLKNGVEAVINCYLIL